MSSGGYGNGGGADIEIACKCGYTCGTRKALDKHLLRFPGDDAHQALGSKRTSAPEASVGGCEAAAKASAAAKSSGQKRARGAK